MRPHAGTVPLGQAPVTRPRRAVVIGFVGAALLALSIAIEALLPGDTLRQLDERLFVFLNSLGSARWDGVWLVITDKRTWFPMLAVLAFLMHRRFGLKNMLILMAMITAMITLTDQLANVFKDGVERLRPCREAHLQEFIRYVAPRCGRYGFFSAHAANSMALAVFAGLLFKDIHRHLLLVLLLLTAIVSYSRIYLGVHYPLDIVAGLVVGALVGFLAYGLSRTLKIPRRDAGSRIARPVHGFR